VAGDTARLLSERASLAGLALSDELSSRLVSYFAVLSHWNRKINLTSLSDPIDAVDRLLLEPVAAAAHLPTHMELIDLGSGGGSPAIPLALAASASRLVMVESRVRKAAFLREALREVGIQGAVEASRFEVVARIPGYKGHFPVLSVRAVRLDAAALTSIAELLEPRGIAALFGSDSGAPFQEELPGALRLMGARPLIPATRSVLTLLERST
jgi:16S rRNA (guanine527-N7)-methyltransferase